MASLFIAVRGYVREEMLPVSCVLDRLVSMGCRVPDCCAEGCVVVVVSFLVSILLNFFTPFFAFAGRSMSACWI